jgi:chemosensory pili system protein ChpE/L-lysine exporter family protein LysE/ArgO
LWLAYDSWRASTHEFNIPASDRRDLNQGALGAGILLSLTNPQNLGYWAALGSALGAVGVKNPEFRDYAVFFAGFMLSSVVWAVVFAALVERVLTRAGDRWARITYRMCALVFFALALASLRELWTSNSRQPREGAPEVGAVEMMSPML